MPQPAFGARAVALPDGRAMVIGEGYGGSGISLIYDPKKDSWQTGEPMPVSQSDGAVASGPDGRVYVFGGTTGEWPYLQASNLDGQAKKRAGRCDG